VPELLATGKMIIASVAHQFPGDGRRGGHLILLHERAASGGEIYLTFMDPSDWGASHTTIPFARFCKSFALHGIVLARKDNVMPHLRVMNATATGLNTIKPLMAGETASPQRVSEFQGLSTRPGERGADTENCYGTLSGRYR
jgi:hypothetical protein